MCDPVTAAIIVGATAVAGTAANAVAQIKGANAQTKAINEQRAVVREETRQEATGELFDQMRASRREQAQIRTAAGEAGLGLNSGSIEGLLLDSAMQSELQGSRTIANMEGKHRSTEAEANSMLSRISKLTGLGAGLQVATTSASAWSGVRAAKITSNAAPKRPTKNN